MLVPTIILPWHIVFPSLHLQLRGLFCLPWTNQGGILNHCLSVERWHASTLNYLYIVLFVPSEAVPDSKLKLLVCWPVSVARSQVSVLSHPHPTPLQRLENSPCLGYHSIPFLDADRWNSPPPKSLSFSHLSLCISCTHLDLFRALCKKPWGLELC